MNIKKLIADLQVCADDDILCTACDRYYEMKEKGGTADCVNQLLLDAAEALKKRQKLNNAEQLAIFRLGQMDMRDSIAALLTDLADGTHGVVCSTLVDAAARVRQMEIP